MIYYQEEDISIWNEDCLEWLKKQSEPFIDLCLTSPPYDNIRNYNGYSFLFEDIAQELYGKRFSDLGDEEANKVVTAEQAQKRGENFKSSHFDQRNILAQHLLGL